MLLRACVIAVAFFLVVMAADHGVAAQGDLSAQIEKNIKALKNPDSDPTVKRLAAEALRQIGPAAAPAVPALIETLKDTDPTAKWLAADALGAIGPAAAPAIPALVEVLKDKGANSLARAGAASALGAIGPAAIPALMEVFKDKSADPEVRTYAADALKAIAPAPNMTK